MQDAKPAQILVKQSIQRQKRIENTSECTAANNHRDGQKLSHPSSVDGDNENKRADSIQAWTFKKE
jgi:hypothetical protein